MDKPEYEQLGDYEWARNRPEEHNQLRCLAHELIYKLYLLGSVSQLRLLKGHIDKAISELD